MKVINAESKNMPHSRPCAQPLTHSDKFILHQLKNNELNAEYTCVIYVLFADVCRLQVLSPNVAKRGLHEWIEILPGNNHALRQNRFGLFAE